MSTSGKPPPPLAYCLLRGAEWFDRSLRSRLAAEGWPRLSSNQSRLIAEIDGERSQSDLARRLAISRQSVHVIVVQLQQLHLLQPTEGRVRLTPLGEELAEAAAGHLRALEREMDRAWSGGSVEDLRRALAGWLSPQTAPAGRRVSDAAHGA